jgi:hypothetical protein
MKHLLLILVLVSFFVTNSDVSADVYVSNSDNASVTVYATNASGNASPVRTIAGLATHLNSPMGITVDTVNNELYVADFFGQAVRVFSLNANGNATPIRELVNGAKSGILQPRMVAVDTVNNEIYVASINDSIRVFPRTASGDASPTRIISGVNTLINNPISISLDRVNDELVVDSYDVGGSNVPGLLVFNRTDNGNVPPKRIISGNNTQMGTFSNYARVDAANNEIFSQGDDGSGVLTFSRTATGNAAPLRNLTGASTGLTGVGGFLPDLANNRLMVVDGASNTIRVFARTATGNATPLMTISGPSTGLSAPWGIDVDSSGGFTATETSQQVAVPALNDWGLIVFMLFAGLSAVFCLKRQKRA